MGIDRLERVMWRLRKTAKTKRPTYNEVKLAIMYECGTDPRTIKVNLKALKTLHWLKRYNKSRFSITDKDLTG